MRLRNLAALALTTIALVELQGPDHQRIWVNPAEVANVREPRASGHFAPGIRCLLIMANGSMVTVTEACDEVREKLLGAPNGR